MPRGKPPITKGFFWISRTAKRWRRSSAKLTIFSNSGSSSGPGKSRNSIENLASDIAKRKKIEKELKRRTVKLEEFNITLRTLLDQREADRKALERQIMTNIDDLIIPCVERLKDTALTKQANSLIQSLQDNLQTLTSPFLSKIKANTHLTSTELQIANFIKKGKRSKEIGAIMKLSAATVNVHRNSIRKKLGITRKKISLQTYLLNES